MHYFLTVWCPKLYQTPGSMQNLLCTFKWMHWYLGYLDWCHSPHSCHIFYVVQTYHFYWYRFQINIFFNPWREILENYFPRQLLYQHAKCAGLKNLSPQVKKNNSFGIWSIINVNRNGSGNQNLTDLAQIFSERSVSLQAHKNLCKICQKSRIHQSPLILAWRETDMKVL